MMSDYVPHHLGFSHIDHETFVREYNTPLAKTLFTSNGRIPRQDSTDRTDELRNDDNLEDICEN
jgi:hypothetical protein